jgi:5-methylcytosine-specific restriction endonuclease McrA
VAKVLKTRAGGTWSEARYWSFIRSALRLAWQKYPVKWQVKKAASRPSQLDDKRTKFEYQCSGCGEWFKGVDCEVDHIQPAGELKAYDDLPCFVRNLFCEADNLQVLCKTCHKTRKERR